MDRNLAQRIAVSAVAIPLVFAVVWYGGWPLVALLAGVAVLGAHELYGLSRRAGPSPLDAAGLGAAALIPPAVYAVLCDPQGPVAAVWPYAAALWLVLLLGLALWRRPPGERPLEAVAVTVFAVVYAAALPAFLLDIRHRGHDVRSWAGAWLVFFPLVVTWVGDTAAMFAGRAIGGPKLAPVVSPGKTRAGSVAGVIGALVVAPVFALFVFPPLGVAGSLAALLLIAAVLGVLGQVGDLAESLFKREAGVKDSSHLIPGHGGVLDRLDALYVVIPVTAALYRALGVR
ncbi:MAG: phosphatidate cytidylyltransferase [Deltaproteobacteria bacterium]